VQTIIGIGAIGISYASLLFLVAVGLSIVFGLMRFVNLASGSFYMLGAYLAISIVHRGMSFWLAVLIGGVVVGLIGLVIEQTILQRLHRQELLQVCLTIGLMYIVEDLARVIWGGDPLRLRPPASLRGSISLLGAVVPLYRVGLIVIGIVLALVLWLLIERTRWGAFVRAGVDDLEMCECLGINTRVVFAVIFTIGVFLSGLAGALGAPLLGVAPGTDADVLLMALIVVVLGGLGSISGSVLASLVVGILDSVARMRWPGASFFIIYAIMALVLIVRPQGFRGRYI